MQALDFLLKCGCTIYEVTTIKASDTLEHPPTVWPVPYACAQSYHPGSGSHGQLFRPNLRSVVPIFFRGGKERLIQLLDYPSAAPHREK